MRIAVDAMGGDHAPQAAVQGSILVAQESEIEILLVGDRQQIERRLASMEPTRGSIEIVHADEVVGMHEPAITPLRKKPRSSVRVCAELVRDGQARAMVTAGNTGAAVTVAYKQIGMIPGVDRPGLAAVLPTRKGRTVLLDVGGNVDMRPAHYRQLAVMGHIYAQEVLRAEAPKIGLLSIGEENTKGTELIREVFGVLEKTGLNFIGNVEGNDVFTGRVDVVVCDGFVGNVLLKGAEAVAELLVDALRDEVGQTPKESDWLPLAQAGHSKSPIERRLFRIWSSSAARNRWWLLHRPWSGGRTRRPERHQQGRRVL